jgi:hypothetical protein
MKTDIHLYKNNFKMDQRPLFRPESEPSRGKHFKILANRQGISE